MTVVDKMTPDEYAIYSAINHADDEWTMEATEVLNRVKAKVWEEGFHEGRANVSHTRPGECDGRLWYEEDWTNPYRTHAD